MKEVRITTWNMQGGGGFAKFDKLMSLLPPDGSNVICLQEAGTSSTSIFSREAAAASQNGLAYAEKSFDGLVHQGLLTYRVGQKTVGFYAAYAEDPFATNLRCTVAILIEAPLCAGALPWFGVPTDLVGRRFFLGGAFGNSAVFSAHCLASTEASVELRASLANVKEQFARTENLVVAGDFNQTPASVHAAPAFESCGTAARSGGWYRLVSGKGTQGTPVKDADGKYRRHNEIDYLIVCDAIKELNSTNPTIDVTDTFSVTTVQDPFTRESVVKLSGYSDHNAVTAKLKFKE